MELGKAPLDFKITNVALTIGKSFMEERGFKLQNNNGSCVRRARTIGIIANRTPSLLEN